MRKLYENFHILLFQKRIVSMEIIHGNMVFQMKADQNNKSDVTKISDLVQVCFFRNYFIPLFCYKTNHEKIGPWTIGPIDPGFFSFSLPSIPHDSQLEAQSLSERKIQSVPKNKGPKLLG